nr:hypothetical protein [Tanacetum cinerariifolium]
HRRLRAHERRGRAPAGSAKLPGYFAVAAGLGLAAAAQHGQHGRQLVAAHALRLLPRCSVSVQQARARLGLPRPRRRQPQPRHPRRQHQLHRHPRLRFVRGAGALEAKLTIENAKGTTRTVPLADFYKLPGKTPHIENQLQPGEIITAIIVPPAAHARKSHYLKVRDRASYAYALVSAAVGLDVQGGTIRSARVALGGVGTVPWRVPAV